MAQAGTAYVDIQPDMSTFQSQVAAQMAPITSRFGKMGTAAAAGLGAIVVGAGLAAKGLYDIGAEFDRAYDRIRIDTGATGARLNELKADFRAVFATVPSDAEEVAKAIGFLNTRLGLTGKPLRNVAKQMLDLSRITGTDLASNLDAVTKVFGDFGVKAGQQGKYLNRLFRASQATQVSVADLADTMFRFGSPLRQMGFDFDQTAAMVGKFEKEGVNSKLVLSSLRIALGRMADAGVKDAGKAFEILTRQIKNAKTPTEATRKAIEVFGAKAGPDMAAAIREGRFEFGRLVNTIKTGPDTIGKAASATDDMSENLKKLGHFLKVAVEPLASGLYENLNKFVVNLTNELRKMGPAFEDARPAVSALADALMFMWKFTIKPVIVILKTVIVVLGAVAQQFSKTKAQVTIAGRGIGNAARAIGAAAANAYKSIKARFQDAIAFVRSLPGKFAAAGRAVGNAIKSGVRAGLSGLGGILTAIARGAISALKSVVNSQIRNINGIIGTADALSPGKLPRIPELARGTSNFEGGVALVGEQGPELVSLPRGSQVFTAAQTRNLAAGVGSAAPEVRVFIGDRELTDIVRVEMREKDRNARRNYRTGVRQ